MSELIEKIFGNQLTELVALVSSAAEDDEKIVRMLLKQPNININIRDDKGFTALMRAVQGGHSKMVKLLLEEPGIDVNLKNEDGDSALVNAAVNCHLDIVRMLLEHPNIDVNIQDDEGSTALIYAAKEIAVMMKEYDSEDKDEISEIMFKINKLLYEDNMNVSSQNYREIVELLLDHSNIDVNIQDNLGYTALICAAGNNHKETVELLLGHPNAGDRIDVNLQDKKGGSALIYAVNENHKEIVKLLLNHPNVKDKINVNIKHNNGGTALMQATLHGYKEVVSILLNHPNIDVNATIQTSIIDEDTALTIAIKEGHKEIVELLLKHPKINVNQTFGMFHHVTALIRALQNDDEDVVKILLNQPDINFEGNDMVPNLFIPILRGKENFVNLLLKQGVNVNKKTFNGFTTLMCAIMDGHIKIVKQLLNHPDININDENDDGETALKYAVQYEQDGNTLIYAAEAGNARIVKLLLDQPGIDINAQNDEGETALDCAKRTGRRSVIRLIQSNIGLRKQQYITFEEITQPSNETIYEEFWKAISRGDDNEMNSFLDEDGKILIDINTRNKNGNTALIIASEKGNWNAVNWLLKRGANPSCKDVNGDNALITAARKGHFDVVEELLFRGANINSTGQHKRTALMAAAENRHIRVVKLLKKKGAKISIKDDNDKTVLDIINEKKHDDPENIYESIRGILESHSKQSNQFLQEGMESMSNKWEVSIDKCEKDLKNWEKDDPYTYKKIKILIKDIEKNPFRGGRQVERLTGDLDGLYSRRINKQNRLIYEVDGEKAIIISCKGHYEKEKRKNNRSRTSSTRNLLLERRRTSDDASIFCQFH
ncbi:hypothetical protein PIROE2DRAFT_58917 [Piromyces sp. E2]|nr:hypothetical protein PIROE2DRAFT_58917 [Piromyces sp. E2]|eukprot:OUM67236.1 hypothetical protein PIROE2DRAFT_58917 [Piromyces sp. E2]